MLLALVLAVMTAIALAAVVAPLLGGGRSAPGRAQFDRAVYRDQLREVERDAARGAILGEEVAAARLEIERRLLAADRATGDAPPPMARAKPLVAVVLVLLVAGGAAGLYIARGAPGVPDMPYAARGPERALAAANGPTDLEKTAAALKARLAAKPDDADGWLLYARTTAALGQWQTAADAYHQALALTKGRPDVAVAYGEMLVMASGGIVTPNAHDAFAAALAKDPEDGPARYYLALADAQAGKVPEAIAAWQKLAAAAPEDAPIRKDLQQRIAAAAASIGMKAPPLAPPAPATGPSPTEMAAMAKLPPDQRAAMIHSMVAKLAAEMAARPGDLSGWLRLARAYEVLGEGKKAADAYARAEKLSPQDPQIVLSEAEALIAGHDLHDPIPPRAVALFERAETLAPDTPAALWYLGLAAAQAHQPAKATDYWERLMKALPADSPDRQTVAAALDAIKGK